MSGLSRQAIFADMRRQWIDFMKTNPIFTPHAYTIYDCVVKAALILGGRGGNRTHEITADEGAYLARIAENMLSAGISTCRNEGLQPGERLGEKPAGQELLEEGGEAP